MRAGPLDKRIDIEQPKDPQTKAASGAVAKEWEPFATGLWANFKGLNGAESFAAGEYLTESFYRVIVRPITGITTKMRLVYGSRTFDILSVDDMGSRSEVWMRVKEGRSKGN